jgi:DNA-binding winged helix-turn-helix (wHTH) protein/Tfp pilus assembly protein PilF
VASPAQPSLFYRFGVYEVDLRRGELRKHATPVKVQGKPFQVLTVLLERPGEIVAREELRERLWPAGTYVEFDDGLNAAVKKLRTALNDSAGRPHYIETIPRHGYRFVAPLTVVAVNEPAIVIPAAGPSAPLAAASQEAFVRGLLRLRWLRLTAYTLVSSALGVSLLFGIHRRSVAAHRAEAVQEVSRGRELWRDRTPESLTQAIDHYNRALELDPANPAAYSGLADAYIVLPFLSTIQQNVTYPKAKAAAEKAVMLDPSLADAHTSLADVKLYVDWDFTGAEREFQSALALDPNDATAHQWYAEFLSAMGRHDQAIREVLNAEQLEPLSKIMYHQAGQVYQNARQYDNAIHQYNGALEIDPAFYPSCERLSDALRHEGMYREDIETQLEFHRRHAANFYTPGANAITLLEAMERGFASGGRRGYWRARLEMAVEMELAMTSSNVPADETAMYQLAVDYAQNGDTNNAMLWLNRLFAIHGNQILSIDVDPDLDPLRSDSRFQQLARRIGLP